MGENGSQIVVGEIIICATVSGCNRAKFASWSHILWTGTESLPSGVANRFDKRNAHAGALL